MPTEQDTRAPQDAAGAAPLLLGLLAETPIHYGAETGGGAIDLPVAREAATQYPVIAGSALKGAFKDLLGEGSDPMGRQDQAGQLIFSDVRLLLLPVRSLAASYAWVTCPLLLERLQRDMSRCATVAPGAAPPKVKKGEYLSPNRELPEQLLLEERQFTKSRDAGGLAPALLNAIKGQIANTAAKERIDRQLVVLADDDFAWFAQFALPVSAHNVLDENKTSKNLWYEETLPPDTVMYGLILPRPTLETDKKNSAMKELRDKLKANPHLQIGAGETTGLGWFAHNGSPLHA